MKRWGQGVGGEGTDELPSPDGITTLILHPVPPGRVPTAFRSLDAPLFVPGTLAVPVGSGLIRVTQGSEIPLVFPCGSSPSRERQASGRLSSLMVMISLAWRPALQHSPRIHHRGSGRGVGTVSTHLSRRYLLSTSAGPGALPGAWSRPRSITGLVSTPEGSSRWVGRHSGQTSWRHCYGC